MSSDILGREIERGKFLIGLYEPAAHWLSFILTLASTLLQKGYVVNVTTTSTPPSEIRRIMTLAVPKSKEPEVAKRPTISDIYTWQTGCKSDEADTAGSLSLAKASIEIRNVIRFQQFPARCSRSRFLCLSLVSRIGGFDHFHER